MYSDVWTGLVGLALVGIAGFASTRILRAGPPEKPTAKLEAPVPSSGTLERWPMPGPPGSLQLLRPPKRRIVEIKEKLNGKEDRFELECWDQTDKHVVGRWVASGGMYGVKAGTYSWGVWWVDKPYGAYRLHNPNGQLRAYRFDCLSEVVISPEEIRFKDLLLDAWFRPVDPAGAPVTSKGRYLKTVDSFAIHVEDEDEVRSMQTVGKLTKEQTDLIDACLRFFDTDSVRLRQQVDEQVKEAIRLNNPPDALIT